ncbi:MAG: GNAT family N-acetyltransferase [Candidatus Latescibacteria bacterium]|jgi:RimJ/RimL family protein N-acetyltransferase|nr:GNAT family N-acetyltransferase [Candidatus Latescibacterota bacterium]
MEIQGRRVTIYSTTESDFPNLIALWNDRHVMMWVGFPNGLGYNPEKIMDWYSKLQSNPDKHHLIVHTEGLGFCGEVYYDVDRIHGRAGLDIKFTPKAQGKGLATDALKTLIRFIFESEPGVVAVWTEPSKENVAAQKLYNRCGLKPKSSTLNKKQAFSYWELRREEWISA